MPRAAPGRTTRSFAPYSLFLQNRGSRRCSLAPAWDGSVGAKCAVATPGRLEEGKARFTGGCSSPTDRLNRSRHVPPADELAWIERQRPSVSFVDGDAPAVCCPSISHLLDVANATIWMFCHHDDIAAKDSLSLVVTAAIVFETIAHTCGNAHGAQSRQGSGYVFMMFQR